MKTMMIILCLLFSLVSFSFSFFSVLTVTLFLVGITYHSHTYKLFFSFILFFLASLSPLI